MNKDSDNTRIRAAKTAYERLAMPLFYADTPKGYDDLPKEAQAVWIRIADALLTQEKRAQYMYTMCHAFGVGCVALVWALLFSLFGGPWWTSVPFLALALITIIHTKRSCEKAMAK